MKKTKMILLIVGLWILKGVAIFMAGIVALGLIIVLPILVTSNSERKQQKIIDTFESFDNTQEYVIVTQSPDRLYVRGNVVDLETLTYQEAPCHYISTTNTCAYFYSYHAESQNTVDLLSLSYETLELSFIATVEAENEITEADYANGEVYFLVSGEDGTSIQSYLIYHIETTQTRKVNYYTVVKSTFDNFQSEKYTITRGDTNIFLTDEKLLIKNNQTGEEKKIGYSLLKTCEEGKKIRKLGDVYLCVCAIDYYEYNGEIYILYFYYVDGFLGYPTYAYVMKYDFDSHTMQYYTSVFMEDNPEGYLTNFKIPE